VKWIALPLLASLYLCLALPAGASEIIDRNASHPSLKISSSGVAAITYSTRGLTRHVFASGAVNARQPNSGIPQVSFHLVYGYGPAPLGGVCRAYDGPPLAWLVKACKAPDGSYWALQSWQRMLGNYGSSSSSMQRVWELHLSHFTGSLPVLDVNLDWAYDGRFRHLFGSYSYMNKPVFGFHSSRYGKPLDSYGRNIYLDTFASAYGSGWQRENSFLAHNPTGVFCYGFYPHPPHQAGVGQKYRATAIGPGVVPDVMWQGNDVGAYSPEKADIEKQMNDLQASLGDKGCRHS
jgi:hypothetical protein